MSTGPSQLLKQRRSSWGGLAQRVRARRGPVTGSGVTLPVFSEDGGLRYANPPYELLVRQIEPDVQFAELFRSYLRRRPHHQVFGPLVHREENHLAQVLLAA